MLKCRAISSRALLNGKKALVNDDVRRPIIGWFCKKLPPIGKTHVSKSHCQFTQNVESNLFGKFGGRIETDFCKKCNKSKLVWNAGKKLKFEKITVMKYFDFVLFIKTNFIHFQTKYL